MIRHGTWTTGWYVTGISLRGNFGDGEAETRKASSKSKLDSREEVLQTTKKFCKANEEVQTREDNDPA